LGNASDGPFDVENVPTLADGLGRVRQGGIDAILIDLALPDSQGLDSFDQCYEAARHTPILTLCALDDEENAKAAVQRGAQGWLSKGFFDNSLVPQALRNIIERLKVEQGLYVAQARTAITLNSIGDAVISVDVHGRVDYLNIAAETITGWPRAEASGRFIGDVLHIVDGETGEAIVNPVEYILQDGNTVGLTGETVLLSRGGKPPPSTTGTDSSPAP
jgi:PAS domain-containing protein